MQSALDGFNEGLARVRHLHGLYTAFEATLTQAVDLSDLLRSEWVMAVSALDKFIHDLTRLGMLECHANTRTKTDSFNRFQVPLSQASSLVEVGTAHVALEAEIRTRHSHLSFQHPDKIADAVRLFSSVQLWEAVGATLGLSSRDAKVTLGLIVDRRNKIAHEADMDPSFPNQRWPISASMVVTTTDNIERIGHAIFAATV